MKTYQQIIEECLQYVTEIFPWDLEEKLATGNKPILLDIREPEEFNAMRLENSMNVPRGILEQSCEWDFEETVPELVSAREKEIVLICRSGNRSILAAYTMQEMGYQNVLSLKTGLRGWNDYEQPLVNSHNQIVDIEDADEYFSNKVRQDQLQPK
ncbi:rhodanese-like domain-containing protein [Kaarinaea lacus]